MATKQCSFESQSTVTQALAWIRAFNEEHGIKLVLQDELHKSLFIVQFDVHIDPQARRKLLALSPLVSPTKALDIYATFNIHYAGFDPYKPVNFYHLVTVHIPLGTSKIYHHIKFVIAPIGRFVHGTIGLGTEDHHVSAIMLTRSHFFKSKVDGTMGKRQLSVSFSFARKIL